MKQEIREGSHCSQCGKYIPKRKWSSRDGERAYYFFHLFKKTKWLHYFCSEKCYKKFWAKEIVKIIKPKKGVK